MSRICWSQVKCESSENISEEYLKRISLKIYKYSKNIRMGNVGHILTANVLKIISSIISKEYLKEFTNSPKVFEWEMSVTG